MLVIDNFDNAIAGYVEVNGRPIAVYNYDTMVSDLAKQFVGGDTVDIFQAVDQARDYIEFNVVGAYLGDDTPLILYPGDRDKLDEIADLFSDDE